MREKNLLPLWLLVVAFVSLTLSLVVHASTTISQSYTAKSQLPVGSIVSLEKNSSDHVIPANSASVDNIFGVVINADTALLSLSSDDKNQVQVATNGIVQVLVSDINGKISEGDHITASPINGVGMKATGNVRIVGVAQSGPNGESKQTYKDKDGHEKSVNVSEVPILVNVAYFFKEPEKTVIPTAFQNVANSVAGKSVSTLPVVITGAIFLVMLIIVVSIIYTMIRSSIISIGRNPLSQSAVYRDLIQLSGLVLVILAVGLTAMYLVLTRLS